MNVSKKKIEIAMARGGKTVNDITAAGMGGTTYRKIIRNQSGRPETIGKLARILGVDVTEIIED